MTVKIESLAFWNAFTYRECSVPLADQGLVLLQGKNGHGKSTPWEVLEHAFYGYTSRGLRKSAIVCTVPREDSKEDAGYLAEVILERSCGDQQDGRWLIRQSRDRKKFGTSVQIRKEIEGKWKKEWPGGGCPKSLEDAQEFAANLLGLRQNEFEGCLYLSQSGTHTLIEGKPSEKQMYLSYLFGVDRYDRIYQNLNARSKEVEKKLLGTVSLEAKIETLTSQLKQYPEAQDLDQEIHGLTQDLDRLDKELSGLTGQRDKIMDLLRSGEQREAIQKELDALGDFDEVPDLDRRIETLKTSRDLTFKDLQDATRRQDLVAQVKRLGDVPDQDPDQIRQDLVAKREDLHRADQMVLEINKRTKLEQELVGLPETSSVQDLTESIGFLEKSLEVKRTRYKERLAEYKELEKQLAEFKTGVCPTCRRPMDTETMKSRLNDLNAETNALYDEIQKPKQKLAGLQEELVRSKHRTDLMNQIQPLAQGPVEPVVQQVQRVKDEIANLEDLVTRLNKAKVLQDQLSKIKIKGDPDELQNDLDTLDQEIRDSQETSKKQAKFKTLTQQIEKIPPVDRESLEHDLESSDRAYEKTKVLARNLQEKVSTARAKQQTRQSLEREVQAVNRELDGLGDLRKRQIILKHAVSIVPKLKKRKIHKIVCAIRDVLPRYAGTMFSHEPNTTFIVEEDEKEDSIDLLARRIVLVGDPNGGKGRMEPVMVPVKGFSGGEKQRLSVALLFTLHSLLDPTKKPDLLILDEVDRNLDTEGVASLMQLVQEIKQQYGTVIMTSHRSQISGAHFDRVWSVNKVNEVSTFSLE